MLKRSFPLFNDGQMLSAIFQYQKALMDKYISKGMLSPYPADLTERSGQNLIKQTIYFFVEELAEACESYTSVMQAYNTGASKEELKRLLNEYFMELGDALHFFIELFVFSETTKDDIMAYYSQLCKERNLELLLTEDGLTTSMNYANQTNIFDDQVRVRLCLTLPIEIEGSVNISVKLSEELADLVQKNNWQITKKLCLAGNHLKMRDWKVEPEKQTTEMLQGYYYLLLDAWLHFMKHLHMVGLDAKAVYHYYEQANLKNQLRLLNNY